MSEEREPVHGDPERGEPAPEPSSASPPAGAAEEHEEREERELRKNDAAGVVTGVCAGLGDHTRIDPVVWRATFAMTALAGGTGLWLYIAAWMMMRDSRGGPAMIEQLLNRRLAARAVLTLLAVGLAAATALSLVGGFSWGTLVLATPLILGALTAHNRGVDLQQTARDLPGWLKSKEPAPTAPAPEPAPAYYNPAQPWAAAPSGPIDLAVVAGRARGRAGGEDGDDGNGDGGDGEPTARGAVDLSRAAGPETPKSSGPCRRRHGRLLIVHVFWMLLAATGIAFGLTGGFSLSTLVGPEIGPVYLGSVVVIIGLALVAGAWIGDPRGLIAVGTLATLLLVAAATVDLTALRFGDTTWRPATVVEAEQRYELTGGAAALDLTRLPLEPGQRVNVNADVRFGWTEVLVPDTARVVFHGTAAFGEIRVADTARAGTRLDVRETLEPVGSDAGAEREPAGEKSELSENPPTLIVSLASYGGDMEVRRVSS
ncbi:phage shock protein PspC (stress-responsive transcriptional regulator) [Spinactinospora alkalitolerans]|uniref:Phage shock protein PspC (Stress-responsive transcriptional regulator) n=1 Tax=Spinactinospora alkalitolerans TaxID=687207 RepID=A0A852U775_9ACTN|nr:PspC domain-containing protein [Spinactinospora alkalitolerans]NYE49770.1 phage shock protein PspC (stress-responsive transcriptional regulator) [Spinactinospora alkalitolerans]